MNNIHVLIICWLSRIVYELFPHYLVVDFECSFYYLLFSLPSIHFGQVVANYTINIPLLAFLPSLTDEATISKDTTEMKNEYLSFTIITVIFDLLVIYSFPMLPRQAEETQVLYERNEHSTLWATVTTVSFMVMFLYSIVASFVSITSTAFNSTILAIALIWCLAIPTCVIYLPMIRKKETFSWSMFI